MQWLLDQAWIFTWPGLIAWSIFIVLLTRIMLAALFRVFFSRGRAYLAAYLTFPALLVVGFLVLSASGMPLYGFDPENQAHWVGYVTLSFSPLGIPLLLGAPGVILIDAVRRPWRTEH